MFAGPLASMRAVLRDGTAARRPSPRARGGGGGGGGGGTRAAAAADAARRRARCRRRAEPRPPQASLPLGFTAFSLANTSSWLAYGLLVLDDPYIWAPNVLGLGSAATQLLLILRFGRTPKSNR